MYLTVGSDEKRLTMYLNVGSDEKETYNVFNCWFR
jgi:hypothetical protein